MGVNFGDARSFKMAVVADYFVNPHTYRRLPATTRIYEELRDAGFGIIKMPHPSMIGKGLQGWITSTVDQIQEYTNRGFRVIVLGVDGLPGKGIWMSELKKELKQRKLDVPSSIIVKRAQLLEPEQLANSIIK
jgi:hypothetical protein